MKATSETSFYLLELLKVLVAIAPIGLILAATFLPRHGGRTPRVIWLRIVTAVWLVVALLGRLALSSPLRHHYMSGTFSSGEGAARQMNVYFAATSLLWTAEQVMFVIFSIALFFVLRAAFQSNAP